MIKVKSIYPIFFFIVLFLVSSCKSSFEKLRTSNDAEKIYVEANKFFEEGKYLKSQILFEIVLPFYKGKKEAEELYYKYAYTHYHLEDYLLAAHYFKSYANSFTNSTHREECLYMAAYSEYVMSPKAQLDQTQTYKAIDDFQLFVNTFPNSDKVEKCNGHIDELRKKLEDKAFLQGKLYYDVNKYISCIVSLENMLKDFPETNKEEEIRFLILKASYNYAKNSIFEKKVERYEDTISKYNQYIKRFSNSENLKKAEKINQNSLTEIKKYKHGYQS